ncbi:MAG: tyrosine--tRNA ligase [Actinomycetota bacterium]|nr:tyrosine--tRNA ligase [Actinomycetota bacterium]
MSGLYEDLVWRGLVHQLTDPEALPKLLDGDPMVAYIGFDPTADSLHVGSLLQICLLRRLADAGHRPLALLGGGTGMIGDPSGKSDERSLLTPVQLEANTGAIGAQLARFLDFGPGGARLVDNADWLAPARLLDFLRDVGKLFSVNEMVRKDSVRSRLEGREQGISFTEFSYMLLQAWDFLQLFDRYACRLQLGGSDQWGNIAEGVDLIRRRREVQAYGLTAPLVTKSDGTKFGKTEEGTIWLDGRRTSPYQFFQFWIRTADAEVGRYLRFFTFLDRATIEALGLATAVTPERREAQRALAREVTAFVHGADEAAKAERAAAVLFTEEVASLDGGTLSAALADVPTAPANLEAGLALTDALGATGLASSKADARRQIQGGGVYVNNRRQGSDRPLGPEDVIAGRFVILRRGKSRQAVLNVVKG